MSQKVSIGIVGLPNVGKSTLFQVLTNQEINVANYPFATIDPNVGVVPVPDERRDKLAEVSKSKKNIPAVVEFFDIAGLVKGANRGEGLGNQFLSHVRECAAIVHVVRCFESEEIIHVEGAPDPGRDIDVIETELVLKDLETTGKRLAKAEADARTGKKEFVILRDRIRKIYEMLESNTPIFSSPLAEGIKSWGPEVKSLGLLTAKSQIFLLNGSPSDVTPDLEEKIRSMGADYIQADLRDRSHVPHLIQKAYEILGLISFFTTGEDETRAWTIRRGAKAPEAAGAIHTDFEEKFIRAEAIYWEKLLEAGSWNEARSKGWIRIEGKDYEVQDGDVLSIRHG